MFTIVDSVFSSEQADGLRARILASPLVDGRESAGHWGRSLKKNRQLDPAHSERLVKPILDRIMADPRVQLASLPARAVLPTVSIYEAGDRYELHVDNPVQSGMRADVSYTLFLSPLESYQGGALRLRSGSLHHDVRLPAGSIVLYPSGTHHEVLPIESGQRIAVIGWIQSVVRDVGNREVLSRFRGALDRLFEITGPSATFQDLASVEAELVRRWMEPSK
jgi:PKHD-type hydroxylase